MKELRPLILLMVGVAVTAYFAGIIWAGFASLAKETVPKIPEIVTLTITAIGAILATNFGAQLGIARFIKVNPASNPNLIISKRFMGLPLVTNANNKFSILDHLPIIATYLYFISLTMALIFWGLDKLSDDSAQVLKNMSSTLIGALAGLLAGYLNVK